MQAPRLFVSYAHEPNDPAHDARVLALADRLRSDGVDCWLDQYEVVPHKGWRLWMEEQIERAAFVLIVATETYERRRRGLEEAGKGLGARWEGAIIGQLLYDAVLTNTKFIPIIFDSGDTSHIPVFLRDFPCYLVSNEAGYNDLYRRLTNQPEVEPPLIGRLRPLPKRERTARPTVDPQISTAKLPATGATFVAREDELARLNAAWEDGTNVFSLVAMGGAGKSALVNRWLDLMQRDGWRGAERVLGWSFYSQGTDAVATSSEAFTEHALDWLGYQGNPITSPWKKGEVLAHLVREARTLLVLDGLEPLQHPPGPQTGRLKDPAVQALVRELAAGNRGLCVITTRLPVTDIAGREETVATDLEQLPPAAGAELLHRLGVTGQNEVLQTASTELRGHGLALTLLGTYLRDLCGGDIRRRNEATVLDGTIEGSDHAMHVMAAYERSLGPPERAIIFLLGLFDRPAEAAAVTALRKAPEIPSLTAGIGTADQHEWRLALARLRKARLVAESEGDAAPLDAHPLVREYFGARLREVAPEAFKAGNLRLYDHYRKAAPEYPDTFEEMLLLYMAVVHGCRAGRAQEVCDEVMYRRIQREQFFSVRKLGMYGAELNAIAALFDHLWDRPSILLTPVDRAWTLWQAGYYLQAMGRLLEAVEPMSASVELLKPLEQWQALATCLGNLSYATLTMGNIDGAVAKGMEGVQFADRSGDVFQRLARRSNLAHALHLAGRWTESATAFREAEALQAKEYPQEPTLDSVQGFLYCDFLLSEAEPADGSGVNSAEARYIETCEEVRNRATRALEIAQHDRLLLDIALNNVSLGRAYLGLAAVPHAGADELEVAARHLELAVEGLREAGDQVELPRGLLARATLRRRRLDVEAAIADLREAQEIAERGSMQLHEADTQLEWARLSLQMGDSAAAQLHLHRARDLVLVCGYGCREREVSWLDGRLAALGLKM